MNLRIINQSSFKSVCVILNDRQCTLKKGESLDDIAVSDNEKIEIRISEKSNVRLNLLFAIIDGFVDGESVIHSLICHASFSIKEIGTEQTVILRDLEYRDDKHGYIYESVYAENENIENLSYSLQETQYARKKSLFYYIFLVSWLPVVLVISALSLIPGNLPIILLALLVLLVFTIPSWRKAVKVKTYYSDTFANEVLLGKISAMQQNEEYQPQGVIEKATFKVLDFLFKKK